MIAENINSLDTNSIIICDPIKNSVMQYSNFHKIVFSNELISLNGLYIVFDLKKVHHGREKLVFNLADNKEVVDKAIDFEIVTKLSALINSPKLLIAKDGQIASLNAAIAA